MQHTLHVLIVSTYKPGMGELLFSCRGLGESNSCVYFILIVSARQQSYLLFFFLIINIIYNAVYSYHTQDDDMK